MLLGELSWWSSNQAAMGPDLVVVLPLDRSRPASLVEGVEPVLVQMFIAELAIEALDVAVLHGAAGLDQQMANAMLLSPGHDDAAGEFRAVVGAHGQRVAPKARSLLQHPGDVLSRDAEVHGNVYAFVAEVIGYCQVLQAAAICQAV